MGASSAPSGSREASPERREPRGMAPGTPFTGRPGGAPAALPPSGASQSPSCASPAGSVSGASSPSAPAGAAVPRSSAEFQGHLRRMTNNLMEIFDQLGQPVRAGDAAVGAGASPGERLVTVSEVEPLTVSEVGVPAALAPPSTPAPPSEDASAVQLRALTSSMVDILRQMSQAGASLREDGKKDEAHGLLPDNASELSLDDKLSLVSGATSAGKNSYSSANSHTALLKGYGGIPAQEEYVGDAVQPWWADRVGEAGAAGPDGPPAPEGDDGLVYEAKEAPVPAVLEKKKATNWFGLFAFCFYICAFCFYVFIRATKTLGLGSLLWYGLLVLGVEIIGGLAMLPYGVCLVARVVNGAPPAPDERGVVRTLARYHVRVLIPCYKEPLDVISKTLLAALYASVPANCQRTVYLLDDGRDPDKRGFVRSLGAPNAVYVSGRKRGKSEMNGKSANINNAVRLIYPDLAACPLSEVCCVFDADQVPNADFFLKMVPLLDGGKDVGMVLSPQTFYNLNPDGDIFNHANVHFWDYAQPGYDALGLISCTGTNFLVRSRAFCQAGLFPEWTLTEDFALGIELKKLGWQCRYVQEYLAIGEAPDDVRNCFQQRSRWSKGHFQVFFSRHNPLIGRGLSPFMRWMYGSVILSYFSAFLATPLLMLVPMITVWFGSFPIVINQWAAISITVYYAATLLVNYYCHSLGHLKSMWFSGIANNVLWYAFLKAMYRATIGRWIDGNIVFKVTAKGLQRMGALPLRDVWMALFFFTTMLVTLVFGLVHYSRGPASTPLTISLIFMAINLLPNYLLLQYALWRPRAFFNAVCKVAMFLSTGLMILGLVLVWCLYPRSYNFGASLGSGVFFLDTQRVGALPADYPVSWRGSSFLSEQKSVIWVAYNSTTNSNGQTVVSPPPPFSFDNLFGRRLQQQGGGDQWLNDLFSGQASETNPAAGRLGLGRPLWLLRVALLGRRRPLRPQGLLAQRVALLGRRRPLRPQGLLAQRVALLGRRRPLRPQGLLARRGALVLLPRRLGLVRPLLGPGQQLHEHLWQRRPLQHQPRRRARGPAGQAPDGRELGPVRRLPDGHARRQSQGHVAGGLQHRALGLGPVELRGGVRRGGRAPAALGQREVGQRLPDEGAPDGGQAGAHRHARGRRRVRGPALVPPRGLVRRAPRLRRRHGGGRQRPGRLGGGRAGGVFGGVPGGGRRGLRVDAADQGGADLPDRQGEPGLLQRAGLQRLAAVQLDDVLRRPGLGGGVAVQGHGAEQLPVRPVRPVRAALALRGRLRRELRVRLGPGLLADQRAHGAGERRGDVCQPVADLPPALALRQPGRQLHAARPRLQPVVALDGRHAQHRHDRAHVCRRRVAHGRGGRQGLPLLGAGADPLRAGRLGPVAHRGRGQAAPGAHPGPRRGLPRPAPDLQPRHRPALARPGHVRPPRGARLRARGQRLLRGRPQGRVQPSGHREQRRVHRSHSRRSAAAERDVGAVSAGLWHLPSEPHLRTIRHRVAPRAGERGPERPRGAAAEPRRGRRARRRARASGPPRAPCPAYC